MAMCTLDGDAAEMAKTASDLYAQGKGGNDEAQLNFLNVMQGINYNQDCGGHDEYVNEVFGHLTGPLASDATLSTGTRNGYPRMEEKATVAEIHVPPLELLMKTK